MRDHNDFHSLKQKCWFLNANQIVQLTGISRSTIDRLEKKGLFPRRVSLSTQRVGWRVQDVMAWEMSKRAQLGVEQTDRQPLAPPSKTASPQDKAGVIRRI